MQVQQTSYIWQLLLFNIDKCFVLITVGCVLVVMCSEHLSSDELLWKYLIPEEQITDS